MNSRPRVFLIDLYFQGHHDHYIKDLLAGFEGINIEYRLAAPPQLLEQLDIDKKNAIPIDGNEALLKLSGIKRQIKAYQEFAYLLERSKEWQPTHIHFLYGDWHTVAIALAWKMIQPKSKPIITIHSSMSLGLGKNVEFISRIRRMPHRIGFNWLIKRAGARAVVHHKIIADDISVIADKKFIGIVPYPVNQSICKMRGIQTTIKSQFGIPETSKLILCFGETRYGKGADLAVNALSKLPSNFQLLIAGAQKYFTTRDLSLIAEKCGVKDRVHFIPRYLTNEQTTAVFQSSDILLLPYRKEFSGQSGPLTMAASIGKPIACADLPVLSSMIIDFQLGKVFLAENVESMAEACKSLETWQENRVNTQKFIEYHSPNHFAQEVYKNYL